MVEELSMLPFAALRVRLVALSLSIAVGANPLAAQKPDSLTKKAKQDSTNTADSLHARQQAKQILRNARVVKLWHVGVALGGAALISTLDQPVQRELQEHRSNTLTDVANAFRQQGEPWYYIGTSLAVFGTGLIVNSPEIRRAGRRLVASVGVAGVTTYAIKQLVGRSRPNEGVGAFTFHPFTSLKDSAGIETRGAFPSGHSMAAFAVATSLADDIDNPIASVVLYTLATGAAWSRLYDNRHWLSDVTLGAVLGITTAKVVSGRWRVFGWHPPAVMVRPTGGLALQWTVPLRSSGSP
jgi:membrane-associated phospholipid phosphatase